MDLSDKERAVIAYLSPLMEASQAMIGRHILTLWPRDAMNPTIVGSHYTARLRKKGLVYRLPELNAWRLTREGRELCNGL